MKRILVLTSTFPLNQQNPINPSIKNLVLHLSKNLKITLLLPDHTELDVSDLKQRNIKIVRFRYFWPRSFQKLVYGSGIIPNIKSNPLLTFEIVPFIISQILIIKKLLNADKINLILANWAVPSGLSAALSPSKKNVRIITYVYGSDVNINNYIYRKLLVYTLNRSAFILTVSKSLVRALAKNLNSTKVSVIPQGIKITKPITKKRKCQIIFAGRLIREKGAKILIDAFHIIKYKYPKFKLLIIGDGPQKKQLKKYVVKNNIPDVNFLGNLPNQKLLVILRKSMLFVFPSTLQEGLPNILLEAGISKLPILTNDTGGVRDLLSERTGYFAKPDPILIAKKIILILSDYGKALKKSNILYKKINDNFSIKNSMGKILKIINSL